MAGRSGITRRAFIQHGSLILLAAGTTPGLLAQTTRAAAVEIGLLTDLHYADKPPLGNRVYRDTLDKARNAIAYFNERKLPVAVMLVLPESKVLRVNVTAWTPGSASIALCIR